MAIFDPNQVLPDFEAQNSQAAQARAFAAALRKKALESTQPDGQMVSGHYVAPHWTQQLQGVMNGLNAGWQDKIATDAEQGASNAQNQAANQWQASLPQSVQAQAGTPSYGANEMDQEAVTGSPAVPYQPVPTAARLKATLEGMRNPATAKEAMLWNSGMAEEATREDNQLARKETLQATLQARREDMTAKLEAQQADAQRRSEDQRLSIAQRQAAATEAAQARVEVARIMAEARRNSGGSNGIQAERDLRREERNADKIDKQIEHIGTKMKDVSPLLISGQAVQNMFDKYGDKVPDGLGMIGRKTPTGLAPDEWVKNNQAVQALVNTLVRNQAGLSQTLSETENAKLELIVNGTASGKQFKDAWDAIRDKVNAYPKTIGASYHPDAVRIYNERGGNLKPITSKRAAAGQVAPAAGWKVEEVK